MSLCVACVEFCHIILVILNVLSDSYVLWDMYQFKDKFAASQAIGQSLQDNYNYSFCYPTIFPPEWFNVHSNFTNCHCAATHIDCNVTQSIAHTNDYINCDAQYWSFGESYQQIFKLENWQCQYCECDGNVYNTDESLPIQKMLFEYNVLSPSQRHSYCTPNAMIDDIYSDKMLNDILTLIICSWIFVILGALLQCAGVCLRIFFIKSMNLKAFNVDYAFHENAKTELHINKMEDLGENMIAPVDISMISWTRSLQKKYVLERNITLNQLRLGYQLISAIFHDIPHTIIGIYYVAWEYSDYGSQCFTTFVNDDYPKLTPVALDPNDTFQVIVAKNVVLWSYIASFAINLFNSWNNSFSMFNQYNTLNVLSYKKAGNKWCMVYFLIFLNAFAYVFAIWCPTFGVIYFDIGKIFYKTWILMLVMFIVGCVSWFIMCCTLVGVVKTNVLDLD